MTREEIREHCNAYGYSDEEVGAFLDGMKLGRADAIDECKRAIVNTESKVFNPCADKSWNVLTLLADRQFEILNILDKLKEQN